jgi:hypothetical protein
MDRHKPGFSNGSESRVVLSNISLGFLRTLDKLVVFCELLQWMRPSCRGQIVLHRSVSTGVWRECHCMFNPLQRLPVSCSCQRRTEQGQSRPLDLKLTFA